MLVRMTTPARAVRSTVLAILVALALAGVGWDVMTFFESQRSHSGGDGLGMSFPAIGVLLFLPIQLLAVVAIAAEVWMRSRAANAPADAEARPVDPTHARVAASVAAVMLGGPALVMLGVHTSLALPIGRRNEIALRLEVQAWIEQDGPAAAAGHAGLQWEWR